MAETPSAAAGKWASVIAALRAGGAGANIFSATVTPSHSGGLELPPWAVGSADKRFRQRLQDWGVWDPGGY
jgi:hypothetical protein